MRNSRPGGAANGKYSGTYRRGPEAHYIGAGTQDEIAAGAHDEDRGAGAHDRGAGAHDRGAGALNRQKMQEPGPGPGGPRLTLTTDSSVDFFYARLCCRFAENSQHTVSRVKLCFRKW